MNKAIAEPRKEVGTYAPNDYSDADRPTEDRRCCRTERKDDQCDHRADWREDRYHRRWSSFYLRYRKRSDGKSSEADRNDRNRFEAGQLFEGKVISIKEFGAFLEFAPGKEGMVHISKISKERVNKVEDVLNIGDVVKVVCLGKDKMGRFSFSMKDVAED